MKTPGEIRCSYQYRSLEYRICDKPAAIVIDIGGGIAACYEHIGLLIKQAVNNHGLGGEKMTIFPLWEWKITHRTASK